MTIRLRGGGQKNKKKKWYQHVIELSLEQIFIIWGTNIKGEDYKNVNAIDQLQLHKPFQERPEMGTEMIERYC